MAITFVQSGAYVTGTGTATATVASNFTVGNLVVCVVELDAANLTGFGLASSGVTFSLVNSISINDGASRTAAIYAGICTSATNSVTSTATPAQRIQLNEFSSGSVQPLVLDQKTQASATSTAMNSGNVTPSTAVELVIGYGWNVNGGLTVGSGFTLTRAVSSFQITEYQVINSTAPIAATATGTSATWAMLVATFQINNPAPAGSNNTTRILSLNAHVSQLSQV